MTGRDGFMQPLSNALKMPPDLNRPGLLVGWSLETEHLRHPIGFDFGDERMTRCCQMKLA